MWDEFMDKLRVCIVGSKFAATLHAECYRRTNKVVIVAVAALDDRMPKFGISSAGGLVCMKVVEGFYRSATEGKTIKIKP